VEKEELTEEIHLSEIDEYLAAKTAEHGGAALGLVVEKSGDEGQITLRGIKVRRGLGDRTTDFELSLSEYLDLDDRGLDDLLASPLITSSALELFDFLLLRFSGFSCVIEFTGNAWKVKIYNAV